MNVVGKTASDLFEELERRVPRHGSPGMQWRGELGLTMTDGSRHHVAADARLDGQRRWRARYWFDGKRVLLAKPQLLALTCPCSECPQAEALRARWRAFHGEVPTPARAPSQREVPTLIEEQVFEVGGQRFEARPARFSGILACPHAAHPPLAITRAGVDLFADGQCIAGGVVGGPQVARPRLPDLAAAKAYALARWLETQAALGRARHGRPAAPDGGDPGAASR